MLCRDQQKVPRTERSSIAAGQRGSGARRVGRPRVGPQQARRAQVAQARGAVGRKQHACGRHAQVRDAVAVQEVQRARKRQRHPAAPARRAWWAPMTCARRGATGARAREVRRAHTFVAAGAACRMRERTSGASGGHAGGTPAAPATAQCTPSTRSVSLLSATATDQAFPHRPNQCVAAAARRAGARPLCQGSSWPAASASRSGTPGTRSASSQHRSPSSASPAKPATTEQSGSAASRSPSSSCAAAPGALRQWRDCFPREKGDAKSAAPRFWMRTNQVPGLATVLAGQ